MSTSAQTTAPEGEQTSMTRRRIGLVPP